MAYSDCLFAMDVDVLSIRRKLSQVLIQQGKRCLEVNHLPLNKKKNKKQFDAASQVAMLTSLTCTTELVVNSV